MTELIYYKYQNKEISTPASEGYLTDFHRTKDWIEWLQKEFQISEADWEKEQWKIQFRSQNQPEWDKLFYTDEMANQKGWEKWDEVESAKHEKSKEGTDIYFPPIYLHPLIEDYLTFRCEDCGHKVKYNVRKMKEDLKENDWIIVSCKGCGKIGLIDKDCVYRVCYQHMGEGRQFWVEAWNKLGVKLENHV